MSAQRASRRGIGDLCLAGVNARVIQRSKADSMVAETNILEKTVHQKKSTLLIIYICS
jgi:hypothetical protein